MVGGHHRHNPSILEAAVPFTLSHPAAVLPLRHCCRRLNFAALLIGSITPDLGYYIPGFPAHWQTHTLAGILVPGLPAGLLMLALFHLLRRPLCRVLPQPHRRALSSLANRPLRWPHPGNIALAVVSLLLGAWTHIAWDDLTHRGRWGAQHIAWLNRTVFSFGDQTFAVYACLQWLSSVAGALILLWAYRAWLRRQPGQPAAARDCPGQRQRYLLLAAAAVAATAASLPFALAGAAAFHGFTACMAFLFQLWVHFAVIFIGLLAAASLLPWPKSRGWLAH